MNLVSLWLKNNMSNHSKEDLWNLCKNFIEKYDISCPEVVYQSDRVIENAYELIEKICDLIGYVEENDYEED